MRAVNIGANACPIPLPAQEPEGEEEEAMLEAEVLKQQRLRASRARAADYGLEGEEDGAGEGDLVEGLEEDEEQSEEEEGTIGAVLRKVGRRMGLDGCVHMCVLHRCWPTDLCMATSSILETRFACIRLKRGEFCLSFPFSSVPCTPLPHLALPHTTLPHTTLPHAALSRPIPPPPLPPHPTPALCVCRRVQGPPAPKWRLCPVSWVHSAQGSAQLPSWRMHPSWRH